MSDPPTDKEIPILKQFRECMKEELPRHKLEMDHYLLRWLRARDMDIEKSALMLRNSLKWRKDKNVDDVLNDPIPSEWCDVIDGTFGGIDKCGRPVIILPGGAWDLRKPLDDGRRDELVQFTIQVLEILEVTMETLWKYKFPLESTYPHTKFTVIFDLKHFTYAKFAHKKCTILNTHSKSIYH